MAKPTKFQRARINTATNRYAFQCLDIVQLHLHRRNRCCRLSENDARRHAGWISSSSLVDKMCFTSTFSTAARSTRHQRSLSIVIGDDVVGGAIPEDRRRVRQTISRRGINEQDVRRIVGRAMRPRINATRKGRWKHQPQSPQLRRQRKPSRTGATRQLVSCDVNTML